MADFKLRLPDPLARRFDAWAQDHGGRSPALRLLIARACAAASDAPRIGRETRTQKLTVRLAPAESRALDAAAADVGLTPNAWVTALARRRLTQRPTFPRSESLTLATIQIDIRRIGVNINQIARALNTAVMQGEVLDLEVRYLEDLRTELQAHMFTLRAAFEGNLAYWDDAR